MIKKLSKKFNKKDDDETLLKGNREDVAKALEILFASGYINKKKLYAENFVRGMFFTAGGIIGATLAIALLLWILSLFDSIPLIGPLFENTRETIERGSSLSD